MKTFTSSLFIICALSTSHAYATITVEDMKAAEATIQEFQKLPSSVLFCDSGDTNGARGEKVFANSRSRLSTYLKPIYLRFFSREFYRLFMWVQCLVPEEPSQATEGIPVESGVLNYDYYYDFRFGTQIQIDGDSIRNIQVQPARTLSGESIGVKVAFEYDTWKLWNNYTLVRENGLWKIDDMSPKSVRTEAETLHWGSKSLKRELQLVYRYSEEQYRRKHAPFRAKASSVTR